MALAVAKHYLTSRESFNSTARYWSQAYAGAPTAAGGVGGATGLGVPGAKKEKGDDAIALAGLDKSEVAKFENVSPCFFLFFLPLIWRSNCPSELIFFLLVSRLQQMGFDRMKIVRTVSPYSLSSLFLRPEARCLSLICLLCLLFNHETDRSTLCDD